MVQHVPYFFQPFLQLNNKLFNIFFLEMVLLDDLVIHRVGEPVGSRTDPCGQRDEIAKVNELNGFPVLLGKMRRVMVTDGPHDRFRELPLFDDLSPQVGMVDSENLLLRIQKGKSLLPGEMFDLLVIVLDKTAQEDFADIMEKSRGEQAGGRLPIQPAGDNFREDGTADGMAPQFAVLQIIPLAGALEEVGALQAQDDLQQRVESDEHQGLFQGVNRPPETEKGRVAEFEDIGGYRRIVLNHFDDLLGRGPWVLDELKRPLDHRGKRGQLGYGLQDVIAEVHISLTPFPEVLIQNFPDERSRETVRFTSPPISSALTRTLLVQKILRRAI